MQTKSKSKGKIMSNNMSNWWKQ